VGEKNYYEQLTIVINLLVVDHEGFIINQEQVDHLGQLLHSARKKEDKTKKSNISIHLSALQLIFFIICNAKKL
jgi:hypothetical protein